MPEAFEIELPRVYYEWMASFEWVSLDIFAWISPPECIGDFGTRLRLKAFGPLVILSTLLLASTVIACVRRVRAQAASKKGQAKHASPSGIADSDAAGSAEGSVTTVAAATKASAPPTCSSDGLAASPTAEGNPKPVDTDGVTTPDCAEGLRASMLRALPLILVTLFALVPPTSARIFSTFSCESFRVSDATGETRAWLYADRSIECHTGEHRRLMALASWLVVVWPVGVTALFGALLTASRRPTATSALASAVKFLHSEYRPGLRQYWEVRALRARRRALACHHKARGPYERDGLGGGGEFPHLSLPLGPWGLATLARARCLLRAWRPRLAAVRASALSPLAHRHLSPVAISRPSQLIELMRKLLLTGFVFLVSHDFTVMRIIMSILVSIAHLVVLLLAAPYKHISTFFVAVAVSTTVLCMLLTALLIKIYGEFLEEQVKSFFGFSSVLPLALTLLTFNLSVLATAMGILAYQVREESHQIATLRTQSSSLPPTLSLAKGKIWMLFISYNWANQDVSSP